MGTDLFSGRVETRRILSRVLPLPLILLITVLLMTLEREARGPGLADQRSFRPEIADKWCRSPRRGVGPLPVQQPKLSVRQIEAER